MSKLKKKNTEYHFIDVNDPERYKKIKVTRACDFCRKRKSKCDLGVPGSGSCSNCKRANISCVFSSNSRKNCIRQFSIQHQKQHPNFSVDNRGFSAFEKDMSVYSHMSLTAVTDRSLIDSRQLDIELFETYFAFIHPFYPVLDSYKTLQSLKYEPNSLPVALKCIIMALSLQFHMPSTIENCDVTATSYYHYSLSQVDCTPCLANIQTRLLMYKYEEIITPVGIPFSVTAIQHLKEAKSMIDQVSPSSDRPWTVENEFVCRAAWIWYINLSFSNLADARCKQMLTSATPPSRLPSLTDTEQYDKTSFIITCNFTHLISIAVIYSQTTCLISNNATLFSSTDLPAFAKLTSQLQGWLEALPNHLQSSLSGDTPSLFSAHNVHLEDDNAKTASFAVYLGLICDTLGLLLALHQSPFQSAQIALDLAVRAHRLTLGEIPQLQFSRFACIQGSRLIVYGLTLGLQALYYDIQETGFKERMDPFMDMTIQVLDQISVSYKLSMAIQDIKQSPCTSVESVYYNTPNRSTYEETINQDSSTVETYQEQTWNVFWDYGNSQTGEHHERRSSYKYACIQDLKTPPAEQYTPLCIIQDHYFQNKEKNSKLLVAPTPFDIINPSLELYPSKSCKHRTSL